MNDTAAKLRMCTACLLLSASAHAQRSDVAPYLRIGVADVPEYQVFGRITDVKLDAAGNVFILDDLSFDLRWFGADGTLRDRIGGTGGGPGRFRGPAALALTERGSILVLDAISLRVSTFRIDAGVLRYVSDARIPPASGICTVANRVFLLTQGSGKLIQEIDSEGIVLHSFGDPLEPESTSGERSPASPMSKVLSNEGSLACDPSNGTIVLLHRRLPVVRAFSTEGVPLWETHLANYHALRYGPSRSGRGVVLLPDPASGTSHTGIGIARTPNGNWLVTLSQTNPRGTDRLLEAREISGSDGREIRTVATSVVVRSCVAGRVAAVRNEPFPAVYLYHALPSGK